ncbi:DNA-binding transcriptional LysR family regulator [Crossiella equi]|uniref:DNA-binding transcriptional LysR family regulator n=1 Tax=Crossiella equi TaxID=130796 RepID=A0ABS5AL32_9PSEU|nr:LysR family transcriptional regulator [Crossiella equi]MBP2476972.1 DNA-binding transcriptional LysR family regulator [Crossiella equi]
MADLDLLETFLEIHRTGSLTAAAACRGLTQPAVSGQLARLEKHLGEVLFTRTSRGVRPTPRADELAGRIGAHLVSLRRALDPEDGPEAGERGLLRLGGPAELTTLRLLPVLSPLLTRGLRLRTQFGLAADLLTALAEDRLDLVVASVRPQHRGITATPFADEEFVLVGAPSLARTVSAEQLAAEPVKALAHLPLIAYAEDLPIIRRYWRSVFGRRPPNEVAAVLPDLRAVLVAVVAGAGVSVLPRYLAESALTAGSVRPLHEPEVAPLNTLFLATRTGGLADPVLARIHRVLLDRAKVWPTL